MEFVVEYQLNTRTLSVLASLRDEYVVSILAYFFYLTLTLFTRRRGAEKNL